MTDCDPVLTIDSPKLRNQGIAEPSFHQRNSAVSNRRHLTALREGALRAVPLPVLRKSVKTVEPDKPAGAVLVEGSKLMDTIPVENAELQQQDPLICSDAGKEMPPKAFSGIEFLRTGKAMAKLLFEHGPGSAAVIET